MKVELSHNMSNDIKQYRPEPFYMKNRGAFGVMVIVGGNGHGDTSSNPGRD